MLDRLLGRAELKDRIAELEEENEHLERQLDAEQERRADAASARQEAQERVNRLEDRIADLEGKLDQADDEVSDLDFRRTEPLHGERLDAVLARLASLAADPEGVLTAYVRDGTLPDAVRETFGDHAALVSRAAPCLAVTDDAGLVSATLSVPNPPDPFVTWDESVAIEREWLQPVGTHAIALVRSDLFAMGEYAGRERTGFVGFDSDLKSQHSKGGFSQARFERLRDEQIDTHVERCLEALEERSADRLFVVGERTVLDEFSEVADVTATVDATGEPEAALEDAVYDFWTVRLRAV